MIRYHGGPITPQYAAEKAWRDGHAMISFANQQQIELAFEVAGEVVLDNGAFSLWRAGKGAIDVCAYVQFVDHWRKHPAFGWAVIPDEGVNMTDELKEGWYWVQWAKSGPFAAPRMDQWRDGWWKGHADLNPFAVLCAIPSPEELAGLRQRLFASEARVGASAGQHSVCDALLRIMRTYHEQEAGGGVSTPGGLEHMGDVWGLFLKWERALLASPTSPAEPGTASGEAGA